MISYLLNIGLGIVAGVITTALLWIAYKIYAHVLLPWYEVRLYKGVILEGCWTGKVDHTFRDNHGKRQGFARDLRLNVNTQSANKIKGTFNAKSVSFVNGDEIEKERYENNYVIEGHITDNFVTLHYYPISRSRIGQGLFLMRVENGGNALKGSGVFVAEDTMNISVMEKFKLEKNHLG